MDTHEQPQVVPVKNQKKALIEATSYVHKELEKCQHEYQRLVSVRLRKRSERILEKSYLKSIKSLEVERNSLRAEIWVADSRQHKLLNKQYMNLIKCHIRCHEHLTNDITKLKVSIRNMEHETSYIGKAIYELNLKTVPETQHQDFVRRTRASMQMLENRLGEHRIRESGFITSNQVLREQLITLLDYRETFNNSFLRIITKLNSDKEYMTELLKYCFITFDDCNHFREKIENSFKKSSKDLEFLKTDMQSEIRKVAAAGESFKFLQAKNMARELAPLDPKEFARRAEFFRTSRRKIKLYTEVLSQLLCNKSSKTVDNVIDRFQNQESIHYSYHTLGTEVDFHIALLKNDVSQLYGDVGDSSLNNVKKSTILADKIAELTEIYEEKAKRNQKLRQEIEIKNRQLDKHFLDLTHICNASRCNVATLMNKLGDNRMVNKTNLKRFLRIMETHLFGILKTVYMRERADENNMQSDYVVKDLVKCVESPTPLNDIVVTQQCPECAEGEAYSVDDGAGDGVNVHTIEETKKILSEKIHQPEIQYRLHSISQCRLPRSHMLLEKKYR